MGDGIRQSASPGGVRGEHGGGDNVATAGPASARSVETPCRETGGPSLRAPVRAHWPLSLSGHHFEGGCLEILGDGAGFQPR